MSNETKINYPREFKERLKGLFPGLPKEILYAMDAGHIAPVREFLEGRPKAIAAVHVVTLIESHDIKKLYDMAKDYLDTATLLDELERLSKKQIPAHRVALRVLRRTSSAIAARL